MSKVNWNGVVGATYRVKVTGGDGETVEHDVTVKTPDVLRWEKSEKKSFADPGFTGVLKLLWFGFRRTGVTDVTDFLTWADSVDDFGEVEDDDDDDGGRDSDPTRPEPYTG